ncbi:hypothetical protein TWF696_000401 [Orbilia brochopaga]|uniref:Uncharacterized protein n=1 Tax=Orbilia brochopaga TaxID=3140254 RepID=A0AAV9VCQ8_9PEZI
MRSISKVLSGLSIRTKSRRSSVSSTPTLKQESRRSSTSSSSSLKLNSPKSTKRRWWHNHYADASEYMCPTCEECRCICDDVWV